MDNQQIFDEAAEWFVDFRERDVDAAAQRQFNRWLRRSPEHIKAYLEVAAFWADVPSFVPQEEADAQALIAYARAEDNVVPLDMAVRPKPPPEKAASPAPLLKRRVAIAAAAVFLCIAAGAAAWLQFYRTPVYVTDVGEQRSIVLTDGSTVELNSRSRVQVRFTESERTVELVRGQALFRVARDAQRPFVVRSDETRVQAVGTQFDVYRRKNGTVITVLEGRVAVLPDRLQHSDSSGSALPTPDPPVRSELEASRHAIVLSAGEQVTVTAAKALKPRPTNLTAATAWTQRQIVFQGTSLTDVVEEFNRYNSRQLRVVDPSLEPVRISGVFASTEPTSLLRFLRDQVGLNVIEHNAEIQISRK